MHCTPSTNKPTPPRTQTKQPEGAKHTRCPHAMPTDKTGRLQSIQDQPRKYMLHKPTSSTNRPSQCGHSIQRPCKEPQQNMQAGTHPTLHSLRPCAEGQAGQATPKDGNARTHTLTTGNTTPRLPSSGESTQLRLPTHPNPHTRRGQVMAQSLVR